MLKTTTCFENKVVVVTEKRDGENTTLYRNGVHARSLDSGYHESRSWILQLQATIGHNIPEGWRVCGENLYAKHSIAYDQLDTYFEVFSVWNEYNVALSWNSTLEWTALLNLSTVPVLYRGVWPGRKQLDALWQQCDPNRVEGYVVRLADSFGFAEFSSSVAKFVRTNHVQTDQHWKRNWTPNSLRG